MCYNIKHSNNIPKIRKYFRQGEACSAKFFGSRSYRFNPVLLTAISKGSSDQGKEWGAVTPPDQPVAVPALHRKGGTLVAFLLQAHIPELRLYLDEQIAQQPDVGIILTSPEVILRTEQFLAGNISMGIPERCRINKMGTDKKRTIYIFPPEDQLVLKSINYCLSRGELGLLPCCLAFRPGFCVHGAFRAIVRRSNVNFSCIRLDITNYFNSIPTERMIEVLQDKLTDYPEVLDALTVLLRNPVIIEKDEVHCDNNKGVMAGMPLAPLLANLYLSDFDSRMRKLVPVYGRYSDDLILFCPPERVPEVYENIRSCLAGYGLDLNENKTRIVPPGGKWEFLGLSYNQGVIDLSAATILKMKGKISRSARKLYRWKSSKNASTERAVRALIRKFQYKFYGSGKEDDELTWSRWYFPLITRTEGLKTIDQYFQIWARYLADGRHHKKNFQLVPYDLLQEYGYVPLVSAFHKKERDPALRRVAVENADNL